MGGPLPSWLSFDPETGSFSGTPTNDDVGTISVQVTATDLSAASVSAFFDITVANVNNAPTVAVALDNQDATEDSAFSFSVPDGTFADVDGGDTLSLSATLDGGAALCRAG